MSSASEVEEAFRDELLHLDTIQRGQITAFTVIAKENTEHAQVISKVLEQHIKDVSFYDLASNAPLVTACGGSIRFDALFCLPRLGKLEN